MSLRFFKYYFVAMFAFSVSGVLQKVEKLFDYWYLNWPFIVSINPPLLHMSKIALRNFHPIKLPRCMWKEWNNASQLFQPEGKVPWKYELTSLPRFEIFKRNRLFFLWLMIFYLIQKNSMPKVGLLLGVCILFAYRKNWRVYCLDN